MRVPVAIFLIIIFQASFGSTVCPEGRFGWQCRYICDCVQSCDDVTGRCDECAEKKWGPGCLLDSRCKYNDDTGKSYQGKLAVTTDSRPCISWKGMGYPAEEFPERDVDKASNYCRNPFIGGYIWCFTRRTDRQWGHCNISTCPCPSGRFGLNCVSECHCSDEQNTCDSETGKCRDGCHPDFQGLSCQECQDGKFGRNCSGECRCYDNQEVCRKTDGACTASGCAEGWRGPGCQTECPNGKFGRNCNGECRCHDNQEVCRKTDGACTVSGCAAGWRGSGCQTDCPDSKFGRSCNGECRCYVSQEVCRKTDGACTISGCAAGWRGSGCQTECPDYKFGKNCIGQCGCHDSLEVCRKTDGACTASGCAAGWRGTGCQTECPDGQFGLNCNGQCRCHDSQEVCRKTDGMCTVSGCAEGWHGTGCQTECPDGKFGGNCNKQCRCHDQQEVCRKTDGMCTKSGCAAGLHGPGCQTECQDGKFGRDCMRECRCHDNQEVCQKTDGRCIKSGCAAGWRGTGCQTACTNGTFGKGCEGQCRCFNSEEVCDKADGSCTETGCAMGWHGPGCLSACEKGKFGRGCNSTCSIGCETDCHHINGTCDCKIGHVGPTCSKECQDGRFGRSCVGRCNCDSEGEACDKKSGSCGQSGCAAGFRGKDCQRVCNRGTYGYNCNATCPKNCQKSSECDHKNGTCVCKDNFNGVHCEHSEKIVSHEGGTSGIIAGTVAGCACVLILSILLVIWLRRRNGRSCAFFPPGFKSKESSHHLQALPETSRNGSTGHSDHVDPDAVYCNVLPAFDKTSISVGEFPDYIQFMTEAQSGFEDEYKSISIKPAADISIGKMEVNRSKNRFRNIIPYNKNRVKLQKYGEDPAAGYINASYIPGYDASIRFIAAQGPVAGTIFAFLLMVWENDVPLIAMVTQLKEDKAKKAKCEQYWPDDKKPRVFNEITVSLRTSEHGPHYITRELVLQKDGETKTVRHMQFISWPDHGTPLSPTAFLAYHNEAMNHYEKTRGPMLVHCSAGVGRTGTFLAMDYLLRQAKHEGRVSEYNCVVDLRKHRVNMVQSLDQYRFIHEALLEALHCGKVVHDVTLFEAWMNEQHGEDIKTQFQMLGKMRRVVRPEDTKAGKLEENKMKNRNLRLLPLDKWRPLLMTPVPHSNDYINAVFVKADRRSDGILVTQSPLKNTVNDMWRLIHDYEGTVIVSLNLFKTEDFPDYTKSSTYGPFNVSVKSSTAEEYFINAVVTYSVRGEKLKTVHLTTTLDTPEESLPDIDSFIALVEATQCARQENMSGRTVVHCRTGLNHSGLFCALSQVCQKIKYEHEVDVFHAVKQIRISRPEFITSLEEYQWLHQAALHYIQSFSTYANFR